MLIYKKVYLSVIIGLLAIHVYLMIKFYKNNFKK